MSYPDVRYNYANPDNRYHLPKQPGVQSRCTGEVVNSDGVNAYVPAVTACQQVADARTQPIQISGPPTFSADSITSGNGAQGADGAQGAQGTPGPQGPGIGSQGFQGTTGAQGTGIGVQGFQGTAGAQGNQGSTPTVPTASVLKGSGGSLVAAVAGTDYVTPTGNGSALTVTSTNGSTSRTLATRFNDTLNVLDFGAVANGSTDNATAFAAVATAINANPLTTSQTVYFPPGKYNYSNGLTFTTPVILMGTTGSILNYTGTGNAVTMGPSGLSDITYHLMYKVEDLTFTGGGSMTQGIFFYNFVTIAHLINVYFYNFGNSAAANVYLSGDNWDTLLSQCELYTNLTGATNWVWVAQENLNSTRLRVISCLGTVQGSGRGYGFRFNGVANELSHCKIEGFNPTIIVGPLADGLTIHDSYFENLTNNGMIQYGQEPANSTNLGNYIANLTVSNCFANLHNGDLSFTGALLSPRNTSTGLQALILKDNYISGLATATSLVQLNTGNSSQNGIASDNRGTITTYNDTYSGGFWQETSLNQITALATDLTGAYVNLKAAKNVTSGSGGAAAVRFYDGATLSMQFIATLGNSGGSRYGGIQVNVDRDGNKLPLWFFTQDSTGALQAGLQISAGQTSGQGGVLSGNGSGLTSLNATNLSSGTVSTSRLPSDTAYNDVNNHWSIAQDFTPAVSGSVLFLHRLNSGADAAGLWALSVQNAAAGDSIEIGCSSSAYSTGGALTWIGNSQPFIYYPSANGLKIGTGVGSTAVLTLDSSLNATFGNNVAATTFSGSGASLTSLNATNISSGTVADARLSANVPLLNATNTFTSAQTISPASGAIALTCNPAGSGAVVQVNRIGTGAGNGQTWQIAVQNAAASDLLLFGCSSSTYTTGGTLGWVGNSQPYLYMPSAGLKFGIGAGATPIATMNTSGITMGDGMNIPVGSTTGTKIGTATSQKLGFFNATPVVQQTGDIPTALSNLGLIASPTVPTTGVEIDSHFGLITADTDGATITFNLNTSDKHTVTLGGNRTLALSNGTVGQAFIIILKQDGTGNRTVTWWSTILWQGGTAPTLTTTATKIDTFTFLQIDSTPTYIGYITGQNF